VASACRPADSAKVSIFVPDTTNWDIDNPYLRQLFVIYKHL
jgi:hypothetical protein